MKLDTRIVPESLANTWSAWDRSLSTQLFQSVGQIIPRRYLKLLEHSGNGLVWLFAAIVLLLTPSVTLPQRCVISNFLVAFVVDLVLIGTLKSVVRRPRPVYNAAGDFILVVSIDQYSFPSGHASRSDYVSWRLISDLLHANQRQSRKYQTGCAKASCMLQGLLCNHLCMHLPGAPASSALSPGMSVGSEHSCFTSCHGQALCWRCLCWSTLGLSDYWHHHAGRLSIARQQILHMHLGVQGCIWEHQPRDASVPHFIPQSLTTLLTPGAGPIPSKWLCIERASVSSHIQQRAEISGLSLPASAGCVILQQALQVSSQ